MKIFGEYDFRDWAESVINEMLQEIHAEDENKFLNMNEQKYVDYLASKYAMGPLEIFWDKMTVSQSEIEIRGDRFPKSFFVMPDKTYKKPVITYHIPYTGNGNLLRLIPSTRILWTTEVDESGNEIKFDVINWNNFAIEIKRQADSIILNIQTQWENFQKELHAFDNDLQAKAAQLVKARKSKILSQSNLLAELGVPIKKSDSVPETFAVPVAKKRKILPKPEAPSTSFTPEPTMDADTYAEILRIIQHTGIEMERHPSIYKDKDEPDLRDHIIMVLSPHFQSVTGETFNKTGKTDILVKHEGKNLFVAECKFWKGIKAHFDTIDQALGYLTWRDSKAAIVYFIQNKELNPVLEQIEEKTSEHPCFVKKYEKANDSQFPFDFHLINDKTRGVKLSILCFHIPNISKVKKAG